MVRRTFLFDLVIVIMKVGFPPEEPFELSPMLGQMSVQIEGSPDQGGSLSGEEADMGTSNHCDDLT